MMKTPIGADGKDELYETQLPPQIRQRYLNSPKPPVQPKQRSNTSLWIAVAVLGTIALASQLSRHEDHVVAAPSLPPTPVATPAAPIVPLVRQDAPRATLVAPRAVLVAPRATLVRLPDQWRVGQTRALQMPYGLEVVATLRGIRHYWPITCHRQPTG